MSIKRQIQYQFKNLLQAFTSWRLPAWVNGWAIKVFLIAIILFFGSSYILKIASGASSSYEIHKLENQAQNLEEDLNKLKVAVAEYSSLSSINSRLKETGMVPVGSLTFYDTEEQKVAKR